jgi:hypothetical protein
LIYAVRPGGTPLPTGPLLLSLAFTRAAPADEEGLWRCP